MKKLLLLLLILLPSLVLADNVSVEKARNIAAIWAGRNKTGISTNASSIKLIWNGEKPGSIASQNTREPAFYVFSTGEKGFVIVAGEDNVAPILGYSEINGFSTENMPENVAEWFSQIRDFINYGRENKLAPTSKTKKQWLTFNTSGITPAATPVKYFQTPNWDQLYPYNTLCPKDCYCGCVATAMSEILRYIQYPEKGTGTVPGYTTSSNKTTISAHDLGEVYDYSKMPMSYSSSNPWSAESVNQVSRLIYDCGTMVEMDYTKNGSGAYSEDVASALIKYMGIDASCHHIEASMFSTNDWINKLKAQLDEGYPIYYSASRNGGGHAFVADGYNSEDQIHINFGWSGNGNGYYTFPEFGTPSTYVYNLSHAAVFGIKPNTGGKAIPIIGFERNNNNDKGLKCSVSKLKLNESFTITAEGIIFNAGNDAFSGDVAVGQTDENENFIGIVSSTKLSMNNLSPRYGYSNRTFTCSLTKGKTGDKLLLFFKPSGTSTWIPTYYDHQTSSFAGFLTIQMDEPDVNNATVSYDKTTKTMTVKTETGVKVVVKNSTDVEIKSGISQNGDTTTIDMSSYEAGTYTLTLSYSKASKSISFTIGN